MNIHVERDVKKDPGSQEIPEDRFERKIIEDDKCIFCGNRAFKKDLCGKCSIRATISPLSLIDLHFILPVLSFIISFLLLKGEIILDKRLDLFSGRGDELGFLFISLSLFSCFLLIMERRGSVSKIKNLTRSFFIILLPVGILSLLPLLTMGLGPVQMMMPLFILPLMVILYVLDRKNFSNRTSVDIIVLLLGSSILCSGFFFSFSGRDIGSIIWFISGEHIAIFGLLLLYISIFRISNNSDTSTRTTMSVIALSTSVSILLLVGISRPIFGENGYIDDSLALMSLIVLAISIMAKMNIRMKEFIMISSFKTVERSLKRASILEKNNKDFYALQQYDEALNVNPIHELGRQYYKGSIIARLESRTAREHLSFEPTEYDISYNEKAKILSSQSRWSEAVKQYREALRKRPDHIITYLELSMLLASIPGKRKESEDNLKFFIYSKRTYLKRWFEVELSPEMLHWIASSYDLYIETLEKKLNLLNEMSKGGDIWAYYSLGRD